VIACSACATRNPPNARFCSECGSSLRARTCRACGGELVEGANFCSSCGTPVEPRADGAAAAASSATTIEERRIVTILFVDLIGFTERFDRADPEDVRRTLIPFHAGVQRDLEQFGGTLDKFIGDAVMGVFGAPVAHEDDPVRAVRAAMRILRTIQELRRTDPDIAVRIAVNTGEAVVSFGTGPQVGEAVAGDVVNTTSRMQSLAPRDAIVIGEGTLRAVRHRFRTEPLPASAVKGKSEPLEVWRVIGERTQSSVDLGPTAFVGRRRELDQLLAMFELARQASEVRSVSVIAEPGVGKTRLLEELRLRIGQSCRWLTGRCLPYGEAVTFAPVAETVRELAGIRPNDDAGEAQQKLVRLAVALETNATEGDWLVSRLRPILGIDHGDAQTTIRPRETAEAWARLLSSAAGEGMVVSLEDLHWADAALLEVVEGLADALPDRPILLLSTARPELLERHPRPTPGRPNATTIALEALSEDETTQLLRSLVTEVVLPATAREAVLERAGGNPLYALEFARMLGEVAAAPMSDELATPTSVQAVIGARLDRIPTSLRTVVQDASVIGTSFWLGAIASMEKRSESHVNADVEDLIRRGIVEPHDVSAFDDQREYGITHALIREVAYGRLPRVERARRHCSVGAWMERVAGDRAEERAEMLARHFAVAAELADAAGAPDVADAARGPAVRWLLSAGDRAMRVDPAGAFSLFDRAANIAEDGSSDRARALLSSARAGRRSGRADPREVLRRYEASLTIRRGLDDVVGIGEALTSVGSQLGAIGETGRSRETLAEAVRVLEGAGPGPQLARAYAYRAEEEMFAGRVRESMAFADRALDLVGREEDELVVMCLHIRGDARCSLGDEAGLKDLERALQVAERSGNAADVVTSESYLSDRLWAMEGPAAAIVHAREGTAIAKRRGVIDQGLWARAGEMNLRFEIGDWDQAMVVCDEILAVGEERLDGALLTVARTMKSRIAGLRGRLHEAVRPEALLELARRVEELHALCPALAVAAELAVAHDRGPEAAAYLEEFAIVTSGVADEYRESRLASVARCCVDAGVPEIARRMIEQSRGLVRRDELNVVSARATVAEANGETETARKLYAEAADGWRRFGTPFEEAQVLLGSARCSDDPAAGRRAEELLTGLGVATS
jgi:class 3 adenylate cyclase